MVDNHTVLLESSRVDLLIGFIVLRRFEGQAVISENAKSKNV